MTTEQARINRGYGIAAARLGAPYGQYRATGPMYPMNHGIGAMFADFDVDPLFGHKAPAKYGIPVYYGLFDATNVLVGDYLVGPMGTFFVGNMEPDKPTLCVRCNRTLTFMRPAPSGYSGDTATQETILMAGWPASLLQKSRGDRSGEHLPGDTRIPWYELLVPVFPGVELAEADRATDETGRLYTIGTAELSALGWRLMVQTTTT